MCPRIVFYSIFNSHLIFACKIHGDNQTNIYFRKLEKLQEKAWKIINFTQFDAPADPLFKETKILKISDYMA